MTTISVPLRAEEEKDLQFLLDSDYGSNKADVIRRALRKAAEDEAVERVLRSEKEPALRGDLRELIKQV
jgi:Arc/MetJ-type ribon-helix-helix transcriptional regulator